MSPQVLLENTNEPGSAVVSRVICIASDEHASSIAHLSGDVKLIGASCLVSHDGACSASAAVSRAHQSAHRPHVHAICNVIMAA